MSYKKEEARSIFTSAEGFHYILMDNLVNLYVKIA